MEEQGDHKWVSLLWQRWLVPPKVSRHTGGAKMRNIWDDGGYTKQQAVGGELSLDFHDGDDLCQRGVISATPIAPFHDRPLPLKMACLRVLVRTDWWFFQFERNARVVGNGLSNRDPPNV